MSDLSVSDFSGVDKHTALDRESVVTTTLSFLVVVGLPAAFWLSLLELANYALSLSLSNTIRLMVAGAMIGVLSMIWGAVMLCARQRRILDTEARLHRKRPEADPLS